MMCSFDNLFNQFKLTNPNSQEDKIKHEIDFDIIYFYRHKSTGFTSLGYNYI